MDVTESRQIPFPWLLPALDKFGDLLQQNRVPHALLISGIPGMGKSVFAQQLALRLLCESPGNAGEPCGQCTGCTLYQAGTHPDYFHVTFEVDEKTGKVSTVIKVDQIRALSEGLALSRHGAAHKVAILEPANALNINAANSLLKTLEEPADNTVLILVSAQPGRLPATIRSRCQQLRFDVPDTAAALEWLRNQYDGPQLEVFLRLAGGAPLRALQLTRENALEERRARLDALVGLREGRTDAIAVAQSWAKDEDLRGLHWLRGWLMDLLKIRLAGTDSGIQSVDLADSLTSLAQRLDSKVLFGQLDKLNRLLRLENTSLNRQLMMEDVLLMWAEQR